MVFLIGMSLNILQCLLIHRENAVLSTGFDGHITDGKAIVHRKRSHTLSGKLNGLVKGSIHTNHANQMKNQILTADMLL